MLQMNSQLLQWLHCANKLVENLTHPWESVGRANDRHWYSVLTMSVSKITGDSSVYCGSEETNAVNVIMRTRTQDHVTKLCQVAD